MCGDFLGDTKRLIRENALNFVQELFGGTEKEDEMIELVQESGL